MAEPGTGAHTAQTPFVAELESTRTRAELGLFVEHRMSTMTATERRQLDALMRWKGTTR